MKRLKKISLVVGILFLIILVFAKIEEIASIVTSFKVELFSLLPKKTTEIQIDLSKLQALEDEEDAWYMDNIIVAHACGGIEGKDYTNSKEAMEHALKNGHNVIEVDFALTEDNQIVCCHTYENVTTKREFMNTPIDYIFSPLCMEDIFTYMEENPDIYIMTDMKNERETIYMMIQMMVEYAKEHQYDSCLDRLIIQTYSMDGKSRVQEIYPFPNIVYTLYATEKSIDEVIEYCIKDNIHVVTMGKGMVIDEHYLDYFKEKNIRVYVHTTNDLDEITNLYMCGVSGFYTDYIRPKDLSVIGIR